MSYIYLAESGAESSAECLSDIPVYVLSKSNPTADKSCCNGNATESCQNFQYGTTCEHSTANRGAVKSIASAADFPVQTSPLAAKAPESTERNLLYGVKWRELSVKYDPTTHSLKTPQCLLFEDSTESCATLPRWGMMRAGVLWGGNVWEKPIETEFGYWGSPTATAWRDFNFTKEQILKSNFVAQQNRYTIQFLRSTGEFPSVEFAEWIMEFPTKWSDTAPLEWHRFRLWLRRLSDC